MPNYNPSDIVANLKRKMADEELEPMHPWYRGFRVRLLSELFRLGQGLTPGAGNDREDGQGQLQVLWHHRAYRRQHGRDHRASYPHVDADVQGES